MPLIPSFKPKHQKLILQCYPSKKLPLAETRPNNAELSYLIFYASTRRTKLEKVGTFLLKKTRSDAAHGRYSHIRVTLLILEELIEKCSEDLGILSEDIIEILALVLRLHELTTCQLSQDVFALFCEKIQPNQRQILASSAVLLRQFLSLASTFLDFGGSSANTSAGGSSASEDWTSIALAATQSIARFVDPSVASFDGVRLVEKSVHLVLDKIEKRSDPSRMTSPSLSLDSLLLFFDTGLKKQVDLATRALVAYIVAQPLELSWCNRLLETCARKTHIELRYRIVAVLIRELSTASQPEAREKIANLIANLLASEDVNMIGLPVREILSDVLSLQREAVSTGPTSESVAQSELLNGYTSIVRSLGKHIYYNSQINDMVEEVLRSYYGYVAGVVHGGAEISNSDTRQSETVSFVYLSNVSSILESTHSDSLIDLKKNPYPANLFTYLYYSLAVTSVSERVRESWFELLERFYTSEIEAKMYTRPNVEGCIMNRADNPLLVLLDFVQRATANTSVELNVRIARTLRAVAQAFGVNFFVNLLHFVRAWLADVSDYKFSLCWLELYESARVVGLSQLAELAAGRIQALVAAGLWYEPFTVPSELSDVPPAPVSGSGSNEYGISLEQLSELLAADPATQSWVQASGLDLAGRPETPVVVSEPPKLLLGHNTSGTTATASILNNSSSSILLDGLPAAANGSVWSARPQSPRSFRSGRSGRSVRSANSSRMNGGSTHLRELKQIVSGAGTANGNASMSGSVRSLKMSVPNTASSGASRKRSGLAYCISELDLTDSDEEDEVSGVNGVNGN